MGYIYQITNKINGKRYIGATSKTINERWKQHLSDYKSQWNRVKGRSLYKAFKQYGIDNFTIEMIEECSNDILPQKEKLYISKYNTFENGYNDTLGGKDKEIISQEIISEVMKEYNALHSILGVCKHTGLDHNTVRNILVANHIPLYRKKDIMIEQRARAINMYNKQGTFIKSFISVIEAARYVMNNKSLPNNHLNGICGHIIEVCKAKRCTAYGYKWQYAN